MIYLDNAATSWPKPACVQAAVMNTLCHIGGNPGRSGHHYSIASGRLVLDTREKISNLINAQDPFSIVFTCNCTEALNTAIFGVLSQYDHSHVITSMLEHNSVLRPLHMLKKKGLIQLTILRPANDLIDENQLLDAIQPDTRLAVFTHASNVSGIIQPIDRLSRICRDKGIPLLLDTAQTMGIIPVDLTKTPIDLMAFPGHKGLYGPLGSGALYIHPDLQLNPLKYGGTGSQSHEMDQPQELPDRFESGSLNTLSISGLGGGIDFINKMGASLLRHENALTWQLLDGLSHISGVKILGSPTIDRVGAVSFTIHTLSSGVVVDLLDTRYQIACRGGLHCAPLAHAYYQTIERGAVRASIGAFNTSSHIQALLDAVREIANQHN